MTELTIRKATSAQDLAFCVQIRTIVFVIGQNVPRELEVDVDEAEHEYWLAFWQGKAVGTVRWHLTDGYVAKIQRMAILDEVRGKGIGAELLKSLLAYFRTQTNISKAKLSSQDHAIEFYRKHGFAVIGDGYMDAGIPHHDMILSL